MPLEDDTEICGWRVSEALRRHLKFLRFERARRRLVPIAGARGYLIDEDVFRDIS